MTLPDLNVLVYAVNEGSPQHRRARDWLERAFSEPGGVGLTWMTLIGFIRLSTLKGILPKPLSVEDALSIVRHWLDEPQSRVLAPTEHHYEIISRILRAAGTGGSLTTDAHLAALAIEHGATLVSFDRDFDRFDGLTFERLRS